MTASAYERFCADLLTYRDQHPSQRDGQAHFNALHTFHPALAGEIRSFCDPYYNDGRIPAFMAYVREHLDDQP
jgi:hypothetical protein